MEGTLHEDHEDHSVGTGINSLNNDNLVHIFILLPRTDEEFKDIMKKRPKKVASSDASSKALQDQVKKVQGNL